MGTTRRGVSRGDLLRSWLIWLFFSHATYNYERLQGLGFAHAMTPIIRALYGTKDEVVSALRRHLVFFNSEPQFGALIPGAVIALEEQRASGEPVSQEAISSVKSGLMGPLSGLGDSITQGLLTPVLLAFGISLASAGNLAGPVLYCLLESAAIIGTSYVMWMQGYRWGRAAVERLLERGGMRRLTQAASVLGTTVVGALAAKQVSVTLAAKITVGQQTVNLQTDVLDNIMKGLLPLLLTLIVWWLLSRGRSPLAIIGLLFVLGIDGVLLGWLGPAPVAIGWHSILALVLTIALWWLLLSRPGREKPLLTAAVLVASYALLALWGRIDLSAIVGTFVLLRTLWKGHPGEVTSAG